MLVVFPRLLDRMKTANVLEFAENFRELYLSELPLQIPVDMNKICQHIGMTLRPGPSTLENSQIQLYEDFQGFQTTLFLSKNFESFSGLSKNLVLGYAVSTLFYELLPLALGGSKIKTSNFGRNIPERQIGDRSEFLLMAQDPVHRRKLEFALMLMAPEVFVNKCQLNQLNQVSMAKFFDLNPEMIAVRLKISGLENPPDSTSEVAFKAIAQPKEKEGRSTLPTQNRSEQVKTTNQSPEAYELVKVKGDRAELEKLKAGEGMKRLRMLAKKMSDDQSK